MKEQIVQLFVEGERARTSTEKGDKLAEIAELLMIAVPGIKLLGKKKVNKKRSVEIDLAFFNAGPESGLREFGSEILVECKNWEAKADASAVRDFAGKMDRKRQEYGLMFCTNGITGSKTSVTSAHDEVRHQFVKNGRRILIFSRKEIETFDDAQDFITAVREKVGEIILSA